MKWACVSWSLLWMSWACRQRQREKGRYIYIYIYIERETEKERERERERDRERERERERVKYLAGIMYQIDPQIQSHLFKLEQYLILCRKY